MSLAGLLLYKLVIQRMFGINGLTKIFQLKNKEEFQNLGNLFVQSVKMWLHEENGTSVIHTIRIVLRAMGTIMLIFILPTISYIKYYFSKRRNENVESQLLTNRIALISFLEILMLFLFSKAYTAGHQVRYFTNPFFLMACIGVNFVYSRIIRGTATQNALAIITVITIVVNASGMYMTRETFKNQFEEFTKMGEYLENHDLTFGYSSYWNASVNRMIMNDKVQILNLHLNGRTIEVQGWYTCKKWYEPDYHQGRTFLLLTDTEYQNEYWHDFATRICGEPVEELKYPGKKILVYDYNIGELLPPIQPYVY